MLQYILSGISILCVIALIAIIAIFIESFRENRILEISTHNLASHKISKNIKIVLLSDLHNSEFGPHNQTLLQKIELLNPDVVLVAGDVLLGKQGRKIDIAVDFLNKLGEKYKVYVGKGNHELRVSLEPEKYDNMWGRLYEETKDNVIWLINEKIYLPEYHICIHGLDMSMKYYKKLRQTPMEPEYLKKTLLRDKNGWFHILIAHNPDYFDEYVKWGADLTVSGHIHGGMAILPKFGGLLSPMIKFFPKYYKGIYQKKEHYMVVSSGLGNHTIKIRLNNKPNIVVIHLNSAKGERH